MVRVGCGVAGCLEQVPPGMVVCEKCARAAQRDLLLDVPALVAALEQAHVKGMRFGRSSTKARVRDPEESPVPWHEGASMAARRLAVELDRVAVHVARLSGQPLPLRVPDSLGPWLAEQVPWMRSSVHGPGWVQDVRGLVARARRAVDGPPEMRFAGPCGVVSEPCPHVLWVNPDHGELVVECPDCAATHDVATLWASTASSAVFGPDVPGPGRAPWSPGACGATHTCVEELWVPADSKHGTVHCPGCGHGHDIARRRAWLLAQAEEELLPATDLARAIDGLGVEVNPSTLRTWVDRSRLVARGHAVHGGRVVPLYRVGDVLDIVNADAARRAEKARRAVEKAG